MKSNWQSTAPELLSEKPPSVRRAPQAPRAPALAQSVDKLPYIEHSSDGASDLAIRSKIAQVTGLSKGKSSAHIVGKANLKFATGPLLLPELEE